LLISILIHLSYSSIRFDGLNIRIKSKSEFSGLFLIEKKKINK